MDVPCQTTILTNNIDIGDSVPIKLHPYRVNLQKREVKSETEYLLQQSPWSSPCLLAPKSDSPYRFCTDYLKVNNVTKSNSFPLPRIEDCVDRVGSAWYITKLDLLKGYWQVPLTPQASEISAFVTPDIFFKIFCDGIRGAKMHLRQIGKTIRIVLKLY